MNAESPYENQRRAPYGKALPCRLRKAEPCDTAPHDLARPFSAAGISLAEHDRPRAVQLVAAVWQRNLDALAHEQPEFSNELRGLAVPSAWRPVLGLDGAPTYRLEPVGQAPVWLGGTAAPRTRASGLLACFDPAGKNPALAGCWAGAEAELLLARLPGHYVVFVFEVDAHVLAAVLRIRDFSAAIRAGRCIFIPPGREAAGLAALLARYPGLLPPGDIVLPDLVPAERVETLRTVCTQAMSDALTARQARLDALQRSRAVDVGTAKFNFAVPLNFAASRPQDHTQAAPRLAVLALGPAPGEHELAGMVAGAACQLGWPAAVSTLGPRDAHPLVHAERLAALGPSLTLCIGHARNPLPLWLPGVVCAWVLDEATAQNAALTTDVLYLAASPLVAGVLRERVPAGGEVMDWFWAVPDGSGDGISGPDARGPPALEIGESVVLVADLPDTRPGAWGVTHSTHRLLWERLRTILAREWERSKVPAAEGLLLRAERETGLELRDAELRAGLLRLVEHVLLPATYAEQVARALVRLAGGVAVAGRGWELLNLAGLRPCGADLRPCGAELRAPPPAAERGHIRQVCVLAGRRDPLCPGLLAFGAGGWPLIIHDPGHRTLVGGLGGVLEAGRHYESFADTAQLQARLRLVREAAEPARRRAVRTQEHLRERHTYARRLCELWDAVRGRPGASGRHGDLPPSGRHGGLPH
ncbi:MAG: hypothetical protein AB1716_16995 [Planctomycetota bacterium]